MKPHLTITIIRRKTPHKWPASDLAIQPDSQPFDWTPAPGSHLMAKQFMVRFKKKHTCRNISLLVEKDTGLGKLQF